MCTLPFSLVVEKNSIKNELSTFEFWKRGPKVRARKEEKGEREREKVREGEKEEAIEWEEIE